MSCILYDIFLDLIGRCACIVYTLGSFFKKAVSDSNAPVEEKELDALIAYLRAADVDIGRYAFFLWKSSPFPLLCFV